MKKKFAFVDGLSGHFLPKQGRADPRRAGSTTSTIPSLANVSNIIQDAVKSLRDANGSAKILLIVDQLDFILAAGGDGVGAVDVGELLTSLREVRTVLVKLLSLEC